MNLTGFEQLRCKLDDAADGAFDTDDLGDHLCSHAILYADDQAVIGEIGLDKLGQPAGIVGFCCEKHDIELFMERANVAQVMGFYLYIVLVIAARDSQTVRPHCFYVRRPHVDHRNVHSRPNEIGRNNASVCASRQHRNFLIHCVLPQSSIVRNHKSSYHALTHTEFVHSGAVGPQTVYDYEFEDWIQRMIGGFSSAYPRARFRPITIGVTVFSR